MPRVKLCPECRQPFEATHPRKLFCRPACSKRFNNRELARGQAVLSLARAWRAGRHAKTSADKAAASEAFCNLCRRLDRFMVEDREAQRAPDPLRLYRRRRAAGVVDD